MTLYLKYRPQTITDLDSGKVRSTLKKLVKGNNIPHAFLFTGPKGIGKTSAARILAKVINCEKPQKDHEPCNKCNQCLSITNGSNMDVIELDAASNRGIDDIRALKDNVILAPTVATKKIYIIDEAHMLTSEASNAFLKTLEEPPNHVVFILATTNPEKLPDTVRSRLTSIVFEKATKDELVQKLQKVVSGEKLKTEKEALDTIAKAADGSFRDAIKILEQVSFESDILTKSLVEEFISHNKVLTPKDFLIILMAKDTKTAIAKIEKIPQTGGSVRNFMDALIAQIHEEILAREGQGVIEYLTLAKLLYDAKKEMFVSPIEQLPLELAVIKWCGEEPRVIKKKDLKPEIKPTLKPVPVGEEVTNDTWRKILGNIRAKNTTIEALLRAAKPLGFDGETLTLGVYYQFHKERLEGIQFKKAVEDVLCLTFDKSPVKVAYKLTERGKPQSKPVRSDLLTPSKDKDIIEAAKEIFGS